VLERFDKGAYLSDLRFAKQDRGLPERAFDVILSAFVPGKGHPYRGDEEEATAIQLSSGFKEVALHHGDRHPAAADSHADPGAGVICIVEASCS
jgi:hypothetical protein